MEKDHLGDFLKEIAKDDRFGAQLQKIRNAAPAVRKSTAKELAATSDVVPLITVTLDMLHESLDDYERERLEKLLVRVLQSQPRLGSASPVVEIAPQLISYVKEMIPKRPVCARNAMKNSVGYELLANIAQLIGLKSFVTILKPGFDKLADLQANAIFLAISAQTFSIPLILPLIRALIKDKSHVLCQLGLAVIQNLPNFTMNSLLPSTPDLVRCCSVPLTESALSNAANSAVVSLADRVAPYGFKAFEPILPSLWIGARKRRGRAMLGYLRSLAAITPLTPPDRQAELAEPVLEIAATLLTSRAEADEKSSALVIAGRCAPFVGAKLVTTLLYSIFENFWHEYVDSRLAVVTLNTTTDLPVDKSLIVKELVNANVLVNDDPRIVKMGLQLLARLLPKDSESNKTVALDKRTEERLVDGILAALPDSNAEDEADETIVEVGTNSDAHKGHSSEFSTNRVSVHAFISVARSLPTLSPYSLLIMTSLLERDADPSPLVRENALQILAGIADQFPVKQLRHMLRRLYEELGEQYPEVLAEVIAALDSTLQALLSLETLQTDPSVGEIITRTSPILRNRHEKVQHNCIKFVRRMAESAGETVPAREWMHICFELLELQKSQRQSIRFDATAAFASIAAVIGPAYVVTTLVNHLKSPDRQFRITTSAAIASVAAETGPFTTIPVLLHEYSQGDVVVQHGVLKTLAFMFEFIHENPDVVAYIDSLVSLIDDALLTSNQVHRQTAASIVHYMAKASVGADKEAVFLHFLNELLPSIFETSPHVIDRVLDAIDSIREVVGVPTFAMYIWAGLFHPARKVRNVYWRMWNNMYKDSADALVPYYPLDVADPFQNDTMTDIRDCWF